MKQTIRKTLLNKLFLSTQGMVDQESYRALQDYIFPAKSDYIAFLSESNLDVQYEKATHIIQRLSFEMHMPPPYGYLQNLLDFESRLQSDFNQTFISRDHFLHIVHLYLEGVYFFFYANVFHRKLYEHFQNIRSSNHHLSTENKKIKTIKDFIKALRLFVLFHDLGYPIEHLVGFDDAVAEAKYGLEGDYVYKQKKDFFVVFDRFFREDIICKGLTEYVAFLNMTKEKRGPKLSETLIKHFETITANHSDKTSTKQPVKHGSKLFADKQNIAEYQYLPFINCRSAYRILVTIVGRENVICALYDKNDLPIALIDIAEPEMFIIDGKYHKRLSQLDLRRICEKYIEPLPGSKWRIFANSKVMNLKHLYKTAHMKDIGIEDTSLITIMNHCVSRIERKLSMVSTDLEFKDYLYDIYIILSEELKNLRGDLVVSIPEASSIDEPSIEVESFLQRIPELTAQYFTRVYKAKFNEIMSKYRDSLLDAGGPQKVITRSLKALGIGNDRFADKLTEEMYGIFLQSKALPESVYNVWKCLETACKELLQDVSSSFNVDLTSTEKFVESTKDTKQGVDYLLSDMGITEYEDIIAYNPKYDKKKKMYVDHGVVGYLICMFTKTAYSGIINKSQDLRERANRKKDTAIYKWAESAVGVLDIGSHEEIKHELTSILQESMVAILLHNINPCLCGVKSHGKTMKHSLGNNPFVYFSVFIDSIQPWDRKRNTLLPTMYSSNQITGDHFDIQIYKNKFHVVLEGSTLDISEQNRRIQVYLDTYLEDASHLINPSLTKN